MEIGGLILYSCGMVPDGEVRASNLKVEWKGASDELQENYEELGD